MTPTFQAQNPAISGYSLGWLSCTAYSAAMAASYDRQVPLLCTGQQVRALTGDTTGGLNLAQVDAALNAGWQVDLATVYRLPWADFASKITAGCGAILQGGYRPIAASRFDAGHGFQGNHAIFVAPGWVGMDPLADGRYPDVYRYHGEAYPQSLLQAFAGALDIGGASLGSGLVYAAFTRDNVHGWALRFTGAFWVYTVQNGVITGRTSKTFSKPTAAPCTGPRSYQWPAKSTSRRLVRMLDGGLAGEYVGLAGSSVELVVTA